MKNLSLCGWVVLVLLGVLTGCSGGGHNTAPVAGKVTYNGAAVEGATVVFAPEAGGRPATAITDAQGNYQLSSFGTKDGAPPGEYQVTVSKTVQEGEAPNLSPEQANDMQARGEPIPGPVIKQLLPQKYTSAATTDLKFTVKAGSNEINIELKD